MDFAKSTCAAIASACTPASVATGGVERGAFADDGGCGIFDRLLQRRAMRLPLPAHIGAAVIFHCQAEAGHFSRVPGGIGKPRSNSPVDIALRPAR